MKTQLLLKGTLSTLVLKLLAQNGQMYGYEIIQRITAASDERLKITEGALYPTLHKLEAEGLLETEKRPVSGRVRKYYALSPKGKKACEDKLSQLRDFIDSVQNLISSPAKQ